MQRVNGVCEVTSLHYHLITVQAFQQSSLSETDTVAQPLWMEVVKTQSGLCLYH